MDYPIDTRLALISLGYTDEHFDVACNTQGCTIERWDHLDPKPTPEQVAAWEPQWKAEQAVKDINAEAYARIVAIAPEYMQRNMTARGLEITQKLVAGDALTQDEIDERDAIQAVWDQVKAIRAAANTMTSDPLTYADPANRVW